MNFCWGDSYVFPTPTISGVISYSMKANQVWVVSGIDTKYLKYNDQKAFSVGIAVNVTIFVIVLVCLNCGT